MAYEDIAAQMLDVHLNWLVNGPNVLALAGAQGENALLIALLRSDEAPTPGDLSHRLNLTSGRVANILRQLEGKGLITRTRDGADKRRIKVSLTERGVLRAQEALDRMAAHDRMVFQKLGEDDVREWMRLSRLVLSD